MSEDRSRRGFGRVRELPSGRWQAAYTHAGVLYKADKTFPSQTYAEGWLGAELVKLDAGTWTPPARRAEVRKAAVEASARAGLTFGEWAETFMAERTDSGHESPLRPTTAKDYRTQLTLRLLPEFGDRPLVAITEEAVTSWYRRIGVRKTPVPTVRDGDCNIVQRGRGPQGGPRARAKSYAALLAILNAAVADKRTDLTENPCKVKDGGRTGRTRDVDPLTVDELDRLVAAMPERLRLAVVFGGWLALRYGEAFELRRGDIVLDPPTETPTAGVVRVRRGVTWTTGQVHHGPPKTNAGRRTVTIPPHLLPAVRHHLDTFTGPEQTALLFPNGEGGNLRPTGFEAAWHNARASIGRDDLHYHDLRHVGLTFAAQAGATVRELMARGGHTKPDMAMRYQELAAARDAQIAAALSRMAQQPKATAEAAGKKP